MIRFVGPILRRQVVHGSDVDRVFLLDMLDRRGLLHGRMASDVGGWKEGGREKRKLGDCSRGMYVDPRDRDIDTRIASLSAFHQHQSVFIEDAPEHLCDMLRGSPAYA